MKNPKPSVPHCLPVCPSAKHPLILSVEFILSVAEGKDMSSETTGKPRCHAEESVRPRLPYHDTEAGIQAWGGV